MSTQRSTAPLARSALAFTEPVMFRTAFSGFKTQARAVLLAFLSLTAVAVMHNPASAQNANPYHFKKEAFKPDGTPWTGPVNVGDIIKYVLSYKPGTTNSGPVTIDDTLSPNLQYVPPTQASDSGWAWSSSPYSIGNHETYSHPGFGPNTGTVKVKVTGQPVPVAGIGDGTIPIPIQSLNKVFGVFHHAINSAEGKVDCWDLTTLAKCGSAQPNATSGFLRTPLTPQSVVRGTKIYFLGYRANGVVSIGCYDGSAQAACADSPLPVSVADRGEIAGLVEDNTGRVFAAVNDKVFCRVLPAATNCPGWPAGGFVSVTGAISPSYSPTNVLYVSMEYGPSPTRLYIHHSNARVQCIQTTGAPALCPGSWTAAGTKVAVANTGEMLSSFPATGSSGDGGICLWQGGIQIGCLSNSGAAISVTPTNVSAPRSISSFRLPAPNSGRVFFPRHPSAGGPQCFEYTGTAGTSCPGFTSALPLNGWQYGFALDPTDPSKCMLALGHLNLLWRFDYHTGEIGCGKKTVTPKLEDIYCNGTPTPATFQWTTVRILTPGGHGQLTITKGSNTTGPLTISANATAMGLSVGYDQLSLYYTPDPGTPATVELEIGFKSDKDPQICYQAKVLKCGPVFNDAVFKGMFNGAPVNVSQRVDLGKAMGPDCPELTGCLNDTKVEVKCNADGTFTLTLSGSSFTGNVISMSSQTPGVTVSPPRQPWSATMTWTISGATPGQTVTLFANATQAGGGSQAGTDLCCSGEIKIVMPDCPKTIDVKVDKENTPGVGPHNGFNIWVTNVGAPISFAPGELTVKDVIPPGLTILAQTSTNWNCLPVPVTGPATINCTYNLAGSLATGASLTDSIVFVGLLTNHEQPLKNCAIVSIPASVGIDSNPSNDQSCVDIKDGRAGELIFTKRVIYQGPILLPSQSYPVTVTCGGTTTTLNLLPNVPQSIGNAAYGSTCSYVEPTPPVPANVCPANLTGVWTTVFAPPSSITVNTPVTNILVTNTLTCRPKETLVDLSINKTGGTTPVQQPFYVFDLTVTNVGAAIATSGAIVVTDTVPPNMTFNSIGGSGWSCVPPTGAAGTLITCSYSGTATAGQVLPVIHVNATATGAAPYPPVTNCAQVGLTTGSGLADTNSANNNSCVTVRKPVVCVPPQVANAAGVCVFPPPACLPPMALNAAGVCGCPPGTMLRGRECVKVTECKRPLMPGPTPGSCVCPIGTTLQGGECVKVTECKRPLMPGPTPGSCVCPIGTTLQGGDCVKVTDCKRPLMPGPTPGSCVCPIGTTLQGGDCVKVTDCKRPLMPGPTPGSCVCPIGTTLKGRECVKVPVCRPPMTLNAAGVCACPQGTVQKGRECVRPTVCNAPATLNRRGVCECPKDMVARGNGCVARERQPAITPGIIMRNLPNGGRGDPSGPRGNNDPSGPRGNSAGDSPVKR